MNKMKSLIKLSQRKTWEQHAMDLAIVAMERSEDPYQKVGACILGHDNEVLSVAYNGLPKNLKVSNKFWQDRDKRRPYIIHAESNALARIKMNEGKLLACTLLPCAACATNIAAYGIKEVVFKEFYNRDMKALDVFNFYNISCIKLS
jgi:dCMP deaminase